MGFGACGSSSLFIRALSSVSRGAAETLKTLHITTLSMAFKATVTGAEEGHTCADSDAR